MTDDTITLADAPIGAAAMETLARAEGWHRRATAGGSKAFVDPSTGEVVVQQATPEGVPEDFTYVPPDKRAPMDAEVIESNYGGQYTDASQSELVAADAPPANLTSGEEIFDEYQLDDFTQPSESDRSLDEIPEGAPVLTQHPVSGDRLAGRVTDARMEGDDAVVVFTDDAGVSQFAGDGETLYVESFVDPNRLDDDARRQFAADRVEQKDYSDLAEAGDESLADEVRETSGEFTAAVRNPDVAEALAERIETITNTAEDSSALGTQAGGQMGGIRLTYRADDRVTNHEMGHALVSALGYDTGNAPVGQSGELLSPTAVAHEWSGGVPDFADEFAFGEGAAPFEQFLFRDADGVIPGEQQAKAERELMRGDKSDWEFEDVPRADSNRVDEIVEAEQARIGQLRELEPGDIASVSDPHGNEYVGILETVEEDGLGGSEEFRFNPISDADGEPTDKMSVSVRVDEDSISDEERFKFNSDFNGEFDREASLDTVDMPPDGNTGGVPRGDLADDGGGIGSVPDPTDDDVDLGEAFAAEANRAWARAAGLAESGDTDAARSMTSSNYGLTNPHEFVSNTTEAVRTGNRSKTATMGQSQPEFMAILFAILEPAGELDDIIEALDLDIPTS